LFVLAALVYSVYAVSRYTSFLTAGYDLGIFDQVVTAYAHFQAPIVTLKGDGFNIWGDHFHPIVALWAPLYWIWQDPRMLLIAQALLAAASVFPVWNFVRRHLGSPWAQVFTVGYLIGWPIQWLINFDVHEIAFAVPLLAWAIDAIDRRRHGEIIAAAVGLLLVREDMGAVVATLGLVIGVQWWRQHRQARRGAADPPAHSDFRLAGALVLVGLAVFAIVTLVVIPHFAPDGYAYWQYSQFGDGAGGALIGALTHPWRLVTLLFWPPLKTLTWAALLVPLLGLPVRSWYALAGLPIMAERLLADRASLWLPQYHYNAPVWVIGVLAAADVIGRLPAPRRQLMSRLAALVLTGSMTLGIATSLIWPGAVWSSAFSLWRVADGSAFSLTQIEQQRAAVTAWLPANTCVAADDRIADHLTHTNRVTVPGVSQHRQDFYVIDTSRPVPAVTTVTLTTQQVIDQVQAAGFEPVFSAGPLVIWQAPDYAGPSPECAPTD